MKVKLSRQPYPSPDPSVWLLPLTQGFVAKIDADDAPGVGLNNWRAQVRSPNHIYAVAVIGGDHFAALHRVLTGAQPGAIVDHINGDSLDNRRSNLRLCTHRQNMANREGYRRRKLDSGGLVGVQQKPSGGWSATLGGASAGSSRSRYIGTYDTAEDAARAYDAAALEEFGEFAALNFPHRAGEAPPEKRRQVPPPSRAGMPCPKLAVDTVRAVKRLIASGESNLSIAVAMALKPKMVSRIRSGRNWKEVT